METRGRLIYSKRYPSENIGSLGVSAGETGAMAWREPAVASDGEFLRRLIEDSNFIPNSERRKRAQDFIGLAKELSTDYEIGADVIEYPYHVSVKLYLYCTTYMDELKEMLVDLLTMGDDITFTNSKTGTEECILAIDYMTHDCYIADRKIN